MKINSLQGFYPTKCPPRRFCGQGIGKGRTIKVERNRVTIKLL